MRPNGKKLFCTIGLMVTLSIFIGCGSGGDILDEVETRYNAFALPLDGPSQDESTNEIDVIRVADCNDDPAIVESGVLFPFDVRVTVSSSAGTTVGNPPINTNPDFRVEAYTFRLRPAGGSYRIGGVTLSVGPSEIPNLTETALNPMTRQFSSPVITPGVPVTLPTLPIWSAGQKDAYVDYINSIPPFNGAANSTFFSYDIQIVLHCRTQEGDTFNITADWTEVVFGNYLLDDECSE